jgi:hypothetical protein
MLKKYRELRIAYLEALLKGALDEKMRKKIMRKIEHHRRKLAELDTKQ